jgi:hypothetical protein
VTHVVILAIQEAKNERITVRSQPRQKSPQDTKKLGSVASACHPNYLGNINRRITSQAGLGIKSTPNPQNNQSKQRL